MRLHFTTGNVNCFLQGKSVQIEITVHRMLKEYFNKVYKNSIRLVEARINRHGRCKVNGVTFSSLYNRTDKENTAMVYCVTDDGDRHVISHYYCTINFYLEATIRITTDGGGEVSRMHQLAYVGWYAHANQDQEPDDLTDLSVVHSTTV